MVEMTIFIPKILWQSQKMSLKMVNVRNGEKWGACMVAFMVSLSSRWKHEDVSVFCLCMDILMTSSPDRRKRRSSSSRSRSASPRRKRRSRSRSTFSRSPSPRETCKRLHIANLDDSVRRRDIEDAFSKFGKLADVWVASYPPFYAFVVYEKSEDASDALKEMRSGYVRNCHVRCTVALPRNNRRMPPPRRNYDRSPRRRSRSRSRSPRRRSRSPHKKRSSKRSRSHSRSSSR
ncbi:RNA recognition motif domain-containing protein [Ditylenchus destructor]|nr:RNA recognition motif domain-containing protein [Ditylenchus destructor]